MIKHKFGLYIGRFQPLHVGHASIIYQMAKECETIIIAIGSAQERGTKRNPFSYALRAVMVRELFTQSGPPSENILVVPICDREHPSNDPSWGSYLIDRVKVFTGLIPDVIYEGEENERTNWYDNLDIPVVRVSRSEIQVSGTEVRECLLKGDKSTFYSLTPYPTKAIYYKLREELLKCYN